MDCIIIHSYVYELNVDCFSNVEYMNWYTYSRKKLESSIAKSTDEVIKEIENKGNELIKNWLQEHYRQVTSAAEQGLEAYINALKK